MNKLSAIIITQNEVRNICRCLDSLNGIADEIIVVDSGSTDQTEQICLNHGATFVRHAWPGYSEQKNYAESLASGDWVFSIDADEALSPQLRDSMLALKQSAPAPSTAYSMCRRTNFCGQWINHCGWYPDEKVRLWPRGAAHWDGVVHEELCLDRPLQLQRLAGDLQHYSYYSVAELAARQTKYATLAAQKAHQQGRRCAPGSLWLKPAWTFVRNYLFKGGILDGRAGYIICRMSAFYTFLKYAQLREYTNHQS